MQQTKKKKADIKNVKLNGVQKHNLKMKNSSIAAAFLPS